MTFGIASVGLGAFIKPMDDELGWGVGAISIGFSLRSFEQGLLAPVAGVLVDRIGPRRMVISGVLLLAAGLVLFSQARHLGVYFAASLVIAFGQSLASGNPLNASLMNWFQRKRGRAMGLLTAGRGGGYFVVPVIALLVSTVGWRETALISAAVVASVGLPLALLIRDRPEPYGYLPDGDVASHVPADPTVATLAASRGLDVREALGTPAFWLLTVATGVCSAQSIAWTVHQIPHMQDVGFSLGQAGLIVAVYGGVQVVIRPFVGWLADALGRKRLLVASYVLQGVGLLLFAYLDASRAWMLGLYYLTYASGHAIWVILYITAVADYFGSRRFATLQGFTSALAMPLGVAAPFLAGLAFDEAGSYRMVFSVYAVATVAVAFLVAAARPPVRAATRESVAA
jgi:MFS family permease